MKEFYTLTELRNWDAVTREIEPPIQLGILGDPVAHSLSPQMQNAALQSCGLPMRYARFQIAPEELEAALRLLPELNFVGVNLTLPHKTAATPLVDQINETARRIGAVNTIVVEGRKLLGSNTDGVGFARAIRSQFSVDLRDLRVLLLGAGGGAGRAIALQCALENCERLVLVNRTLAKAQTLEKELMISFARPRVAGPVARLQAIAWANQTIRAQLENTDLLVNATSLGMKHSDPPLLPSSLLAPHLMVYDTVYTSTRTALLTAAAEAGARGANGLSLLLHQGALSFETWFDRAAPLEAMRGAFPFANP